MSEEPLLEAAPAFLENEMWRLAPHLAEGVRRGTFTPASGRNRGPGVLRDRPAPGS